MNAAPKRPALRYHGGKWLLAPWIISHLPEHRIYVEPYGGAGSVLLRKPRSYSEVYNDLDGEIVNFFKVLRGREDELLRLLELTPYARREYRASLKTTRNPLEMARRTVIRSFMGHGSDSINRGVCTGFRANANRNGTTPAHDWSNLPRHLRQVADRLRGVVIEDRPAIEIIAQQDSSETLFYVDPPYPKITRSRARDHGYRLELSDSDHEELARVLRDVSGMVVLSSYPSRLYSQLYADWFSVEKPALGDGATARTELLWFNPAAWARQPAPRLFAERG